MLSPVVRKVHQERCGVGNLRMGGGLQRPDARIQQVGFAPWSGRGLQSSKQACQIANKAIPEETGIDRHNADSQCNDVGDDGRAALRNRRWRTLIEDNVVAWVGATAELLAGVAENATTVIDAAGRSCCQALSIRTITFIKP